ncbi:atos homolog protein B [Sardina pilchardus]|uniref:atos homolog protein B n=1 Tax=Sardina pilchardus TaxID=27697 RepID=UPI002E111200
MRHIHVELARKEPAVQLPAQEGDLPPTSTPAEGPDLGARSGVPRPFGEEEIRLQKVYQLSIFSQRGGYSEAGEGGQRASRAGLKRSLDEPVTPLASKRLHEATATATASAEDDEEVDVPPAEVLCGSAPAEPFYSCALLECNSNNNSNNREPEGGTARTPPRPPMSPSYSAIPARRPAQHNHDRPVPDAWAPLSPKSPPMVDVFRSSGDASPALSPEPPPGGDAPAHSIGSPPHGEGSGNGTASTAIIVEQGSSCTASARSASPSPPRPSSSPKGLSEALEWAASLESTPPPAATNGAASNGARSSDKTLAVGVGVDPRAHLNGSPSPSSSAAASNGSSPAHCPAKKKLLSSSDTGESCSEDEGPSTSKRSRLALLAPGLGLASCRSTDAKAAPFWNHLLPSARQHHKGATDCTRSGRRLKSGIRLKSRQLRSGRRTDNCHSTRAVWPSSSISRSLLGNFEESILKGRFSPSGSIEGFTAEIGASGSYCPQHATLPVQVTYYDISEHSAPSPFLGVISLEPLGKKGYSVPKAGTIQVTLFNPNKTVVKMFLVTYNFGDMPVNHMTFLRHRIFLVPVDEGEGSERAGPAEDVQVDRKKILCYLIHLRFQSSKSGKIYLHNDIRLLFSRKSIEVDTGIPYELKSFTEVPRNPKYSPRV